VEVFNAFNHANFTLPNSATGGNRANRLNSGTFGSAGIFGKANSTLGARQIQLALKFIF
jgi:hypothetical protein